MSGVCTSPLPLHVGLLRRRGMLAVLALLSACGGGGNEVSRALSDSVRSDTVDVPASSVAAGDADVVYNSYLCTMQILPPSQLAAAIQTANGENPQNDTIAGARPLGLPPFAVPDRLKQRDAALAFSKRWRPGRTLRVRFLNGDSSLQTRVFETALEWTLHANVQFVRSNAVDSEIRIAFTNDGQSWSYIGTDADDLPTNRSTMQFGWLHPTTSQRELRAVVLHEFGHALGLIHEHQQPAARIPWDRDAVYAYYGNQVPPWSRSLVDEQIFNRYDSGETQYSAWDPTSIMQYPVPDELTVGDFEVGWNTRLSDTDIRYIGCWYYRGSAPAPGCPASTNDIGVTPR